MSDSTHDAGGAPVGRLFSEAQIAKGLDFVNNRMGLPAYKHRALMEEGFVTGINEAVGTGDFPTLFGALIDRQLLANYKAEIPDWRAYVKPGTLPNFNTHEYHKLVGQDNLLPQVAEFGPYLEQPGVTGHYDRRVLKYGRRFGISFEALVNDSMGAFADISARFLTAALRTESQLAAQSFVSAAGPSAALFGAPIVDVDGGAVTNRGVLPLTIANLRTTLQLMALQRDVNGEAISVRGVHLVVPTSLELTAREILTSAQMQQVDPIGGANAQAPVYIPLPTANVLPQMGIQLHPNSDLEVIDTSGTGDTTWYVFADPSQGIAAGYDYLRGHETPEVVMKASDKIAISGTAAGYMSGDFSGDEIAYRVRVIGGPWHGDPRYAYAQVAP